MTFKDLATKFENINQRFIKVRTSISAFLVLLTEFQQNATQAGYLLIKKIRDNIIEPPTPLTFWLTPFVETNQSLLPGQGRFDEIIGNDFLLGVPSRFDSQIDLNKNLAVYGNKDPGLWLPFFGLYYGTCQNKSLQNKGAISFPDLDFTDFVHMHVFLEATQWLRKGHPGKIQGCKLSRVSVDIENKDKKLDVFLFRPKPNISHLPEVATVVLACSQACSLLAEEDASNEIPSTREEGISKTESFSHKKKTKHRTSKSDVRSLIIATLTMHHEYENDGCLKFTPIGNNELARKAGVSKSTVSNFFASQFGGHTKYKKACMNSQTLVAVLKLLNEEFPVHLLFGKTPPKEGSPDKD